MRFRVQLSAICGMGKRYGPTSWLYCAFCAERRLARGHLRVVDATSVQPVAGRYVQSPLKAMPRASTVTSVTT